MTLTVNVTRDDVKEGKPNSACGCPVALAINRALPYGSRAAVSADGFSILAVAKGVLPDDRASVEVAFPGEVAAAIDRYDGGLGMPPHSFTVAIPDPLRKDRPS